MLITVGIEDPKALIQNMFFAESRKVVFSFIITMNYYDCLLLIFIFQDKIKTLEIELDEERSGVELLNDRIARSRDQVAYFA